VEWPTSSTPCGKPKSPTSYCGFADRWDEDVGFGFCGGKLCKNCNRYKVGFMTRDTLETLVDISTAGSGAIAIRTGGVVYATLHLSAASGTGRTEFCCGTQGWTHRQEPQAAIAPDRDTRRADPSSSSPPAILQSRGSAHITRYHA
jgi:hypothetical protein